MLRVNNVKRYVDGSIGEDEFSILNSQFLIAGAGRSRVDGGVLPALGRWKVGISDFGFRISNFSARGRSRVD